MTIVFCFWPWCRFNFQSNTRSDYKKQYTIRFISFKSVKIKGFPWDSMCSLSPRLVYIHEEVRSGRPQFMLLLHFNQHSAVKQMGPVTTVITALEICLKYWAPIPIALSNLHDYINICSPFCQYPMMLTRGTIPWCQMWTLASPPGSQGTWVIMILYSYLADGIGC